MWPDVQLCPHCPGQTPVSYTHLDVYKRQPVPLQLRNAPTQLMKELKYGEGYQYAHDTNEKLTHMECMPDSLKNRHYYYPTDQGDESAAKKRLEDIQNWKKNNK